MNMIAGLVDSANVGSCGHDLGANDNTNEIESVRLLVRKIATFFSIKIKIPVWRQ